MSRDTTSDRAKVVGSVVRRDDVPDIAAERASTGSTSIKPGPVRQCTLKYYCRKRADLVNAKRFCF